MSNILKRLFGNSDKDKIEISNSELSDILDNQLPNHKRFTLDGKYEVPHIDDLKKAIEETKLDQNQYIRDMYDCDNFSLHFHSVLALNHGINTCGVVISYESAHAFNILISHKGDKDSIQVHVFEPQNDQMWLPNIKKDKYILEDSIILI